MSSINFNDAVSYRYCHKASFSQSLLERADAYLNLNGRKAVVNPGAILGGSQETIIMLEGPSFIATALKISSYVVTLGIVPISALFMKAYLRSIHRFHITNMTQEESYRLLDNLILMKRYRDAGDVRAILLGHYPAAGASNEMRETAILLYRIPVPEDKDFATQGLRLTEKFPYNSSCIISSLRALASIPQSERQAFVTQGLLLTEELGPRHECCRMNLFRVLASIPQSERESFVTQALRLREIGDFGWFGSLQVLFRIPSQERRERVTRTIDQIAIDFPPGADRDLLSFNNRLRELLETALADPIPPFIDGWNARFDDGVGHHAAAAGVNVHAAGRDLRTRAAMELLQTATGAMSPREIDQANVEFLAYLRRQPESPNRTLAERAFIGPREPGNAWGPLQSDNTFTIHGLAIPGREVIARLWRFSNTYVDRAPGANIETERESACLAMVSALTHSYDDHGMVCNPGKVQRLAVAVLQGRLSGVEVDRVAAAAAPEAMTAQRAIAAFWAVRIHEAIPNRAALRAAANLYIDQNPNVQGFRDDLIRDVDTFAALQGLPNE